MDSCHRKNTHFLRSTLPPVGFFPATGHPHTPNVPALSQAPIHCLMFIFNLCPHVHRLFLCLLIWRVCFLYWDVNAVIPASCPGVSVMHSVALSPPHTLCPNRTPAVLLCNSESSRLLSHFLLFFIAILESFYRGMYHVLLGNII